MAAGNGNGQIHVMGSGRPLGRDGDWVTVAQCRALIAEECGRVHEHYLHQIPPFVARMIQDALLSYGLVTLTEPAKEGDQPGVVATPEAPAVSENAPEDHPTPDATTAPQEPAA